jgi:hypothetical protein
MLVIAPRMETPTMVRWSATRGKDTLVLYEVNLSGSGRIRRWGRLVVLDLATGKERAMTPLDGPEPITSTDEAVWSYDARKRTLSSVSLPTLAVARSVEALQQEFPALASGIVSEAVCSKPQVVKLTLQTGDHYALSLDPVALNKDNDTCHDDDAPKPKARFWFFEEKGSERVGLAKEGTRELIGKTRWLEPKIASDSPELDGDLLITSKHLMNDPTPSFLSRVGPDGVERWKIPIQASVSRIYTQAGMLIVISGKTVRALDDKTAMERWVRNP